MSRNANGKPPPTWEQMAAELADVGVPDEQARVYVQLVRRGPSSAGELAQVLRISRPQTYRLLESLTQAGFVTAGLGRPRLFSGAAPGNVLGALRDRNQRALAHLDRVQDLLAARLEALSKKAGEEEEGPHFTVMRGTDALAGAAEALYRGASQRIDVLLGQDASMTMFDAILRKDVLAKKARDGLDIRVLAPPQARIPTVPFERRDLANEALVTLVLADGRDALMAMQAGPEKGEKGHDATLSVRSNAPPFVATQHLLFDHLWRAKPGL